MNVTLCTRYTVKRCVKNMPQGVNFVSVWNNYPTYTNRIHHLHP